MSYNLEDIINRYHRNCERIYNDKKQHLNIYEAGIISKVQDDFNANNIGNKNAYFKQLEQKYLMFEEQINDDIEEAIINETKSFTHALASFLLLDQGDKYRVELNPSLIDTIKKIYRAEGERQWPTSTAHAIKLKMEENEKAKREHDQALAQKMASNTNGSQDQYIEDLINEISGLIK